MAKYQAFMIAGALMALARSAGAADLLPPPPALEPPPPVEFSGWYLRGDLGLGAAANRPDVKQWPDPIAAAPSYYDATASASSYNSTLSDAGFFDIGAGYQFNSWFRADVTGEYHGGSRFQSTYVINDPGNVGRSTCGSQANAACPTQYSDFYHGDFSSIVALINGYADLGTWSGVTPYVGAGIGFARNTLSGLSTVAVNTPDGVSTTPSGGFAADHSQWNFAWALMAGLSFDVTQNLKLDLGYRYLDLGKFKSGTMTCLNGTGGGFNSTTCESPIQAKHDVAYNDFRIGLRWMLGEQAPAPAPLVRKY